TTLFRSGRGREHGVRPDPAKLVHAAVAADHHVVLDDDVAGEHHAVTGHDVAAQHAVVRDVTVGEKGIVVADSGELAVVGGGVNGEILAEHVARADAHAGVAALVFQVLGLAADVGVGKHFAGRAEVRVALDRGVMVETHAVAKTHAGTDVG